MNHFGPKMKLLKMILFIMMHPIVALTTSELFNPKWICRKQKKKKTKSRKKKEKAKRTKKIDYSIMHSGYSNKSKQKEKCLENQKSPVKK